MRAASRRDVSKVRMRIASSFRRALDVYERCSPNIPAVAVLDLNMWRSSASAQDRAAILPL